MKRILFLVLISVFGIFIASGCTPSEEVATSNSYVSVEINPAVEFVVDENGNVIAANGTNDDGKTLIINVSFEGKSLDEALNIVLAEAEESGYLLSATYNSDLVSREISVSIDSESDKIAENINDTVSSTIDKFIEDNNLAATYEQLEAKGREYFEAIVKKYNPMITDEELAALTYKDLLEMVELATIEKSQMASIALEEYYLAFKESEFKFAYKEAIAEKLNPLVAVAYNFALDALRTAVNTLNELEYNLYISEDSQYLKLLEQLNGYKDEVIKLNAQVAINENVTDITAEIKAKEDLINQVTTQIESVMASVRSGIESARKVVDEAYKAIEELEKKFADIDFAVVLTSVENEINNAKTGLCESFEGEFADDIEQIKASVEARKRSLEGTPE